MQHLFDEALRRSGRRRDRVAHDVVHCRKARGVEIVEPGHLYWSRPSCENKQAIVGHVPGEVDQDIDSIVLDFLRCPRIVEGSNIIPRKCMGAQLISERIHVFGIGIAMDQKSVAIECRKTGRKNRPTILPLNLGETKPSLSGRSGSAVFAKSLQVG